MSPYQPGKKASRRREAEAEAEAEEAAEEAAAEAGRRWRCQAETAMQWLRGTSD